MIILPNATFIKLAAMPRIKRDVVSVITVVNIATADEIIASIYAIMIVRRRPYETRLPPRREPIVRPTTEPEVIIVLYKIASSLFQLNLASKIVVVFVLPAIANGVKKTPSPQEAVNATQYQ